MEQRHVPPNANRDDSRHSSFRGFVPFSRRITARVRRWLAEGWADEVRALVRDGYGESRAMGSVGYREVRRHVAGEVRGEELEVLIVRSTRIFARRQRTWLHHAAVAWL